MHEQVAIAHNSKRRKLLSVFVLVLALSGIFLWATYQVGSKYGRAYQVILGEESFEQIETRLENAEKGLLVFNTRGQVLDTIYTLEAYQRLFFEGEYLTIAEDHPSRKQPALPSHNLDPLVQLGEVDPAPQVPEILPPAGSPSPALTAISPSKELPSRGSPPLKKSPPLPSPNVKENFREGPSEAVPVHLQEQGFEAAPASTPKSSLPRYPGGWGRLNLFLEEYTRYPQAAKENGIEGSVYVSFLVTSSGKIKSPKIIRGLGFGCDEEVLRLLSIMPSWDPAYENGKAIEMSYTLSFPFKPGK